MISQEIINQIIDKVNISEVISEYIPVLPDGGGFKSICPFHNDTHPSMKISPVKRIFKCFSCGAGGNVIQFVQKYEQIPFNDAVAKLAKRIGIEIDLNNDPNYEQKKKLYNVLKESAEFYNFYLLNSEEGQNALKYLKDRGITLDIIEHFSIGLAPNELNFLHQALDNQSIPLIDQVESGMVRKNNDEAVDSFRKRIMFPLKDVQGHIVGFSGRIYEVGDGRPKYVNSNENLIFHKSDVLYNLTDALEDIRTNKTVYIFEGFMDVIASFKSGVTNCVATMGTALTRQHIKLLQQYADRIVLCFDGDRAGIEATYKAAQILSTFNIIPYSVALPEGLDPDEYKKKYGVDALKTYLTNNQVNVYEYMYQKAKEDLIVEDVVSIQKFKDKVFGFLRFANPTIKDFYLNKLSVEINIDATILNQEFGSVKTNNKIVEVPTYTKEEIQEHIPKKVQKRIPKKVFHALDIIIKHMVYNKNDFIIYHENHMSKFDFGRFADYLSIIQGLSYEYTLNDSIESIDIDKFVCKYNQESEEYKLLQRIINSIHDVSNVDEFNDCLNTIDDFINENNSEAKLIEALESDDKVKDFEALKRKQIKKR